jgi:hypothetical protein
MFFNGDGKITVTGLFKRSTVCLILKFYYRFLLLILEISLQKNQILKQVKIYFFLHSGFQNTARSSQV